MPKIDTGIVWCFILRSNIGSVKIGEHCTFLYAEALDKNSPEDVSLSEKLNSLPYDTKRHFLGNYDYNYSPIREASEDHTRFELNKLGWFNRIDLEYFSPPDERYIGPGTKEWKEWEEFKREADRDPDIHLSYHFSNH